MEFFDVEKRQLSNYNVCYLIHLIVALVAMCILGSLLYENRRATTQFCRLEKTRWQFNGPVIEYSMKLSLTFQNSITPMMRITMRTMKKRKCSERLCQPCLLRPGIRYVKFHFVFYTKHAIFKIQWHNSCQNVKESSLTLSLKHKRGLQVLKWGIVFR